jgi:hypothetical protein
MDQELPTAVSSPATSPRSNFRTPSKPNILNKRSPLGNVAVQLRWDASAQTGPQLPRQIREHAFDAGWQYPERVANILGGVALIVAAIIAGDWFAQRHAGWAFVVLIAIGIIGIGSGIWGIVSDWTMRRRFRKLVFPPVHWQPTVMKEKLDPKPKTKRVQRVHIENPTGPVTTGDHSPAIQHNYAPPQRAIPMDAPTYRPLRQHAGTWVYVVGASGDGEVQRFADNLYNFLLAAEWKAVRIGTMMSAGLPPEDIQGIELAVPTADLAPPIQALSELLIGRGLRVNHRFNAPPSTPNPKLPPLPQIIVH